MKSVRLGDYSWGRHHHGTPEQRLRAVVHGINAGRQGLRALKKTRDLETGRPANNRAASR